MAAHETEDQSFVQKRRSSLIAAIFLMATSAIGPGFITQTATFTATMGSAFAFGIMASIVIDFVVQQNIWRVVTVTKMRASDLANETLPGSGYLLSVLVIFGGLVFNIGNIAGAGLGLNAMFGLAPKWGGLLSALLAIYIFSSRRASTAIDRLMIVLGLVMIALTLYVAFVSGPPVGEALYQSVLPDHINFATITTIVGGTVGGYISYAGAHRLLDKGMGGVENIQAVSSGATKGILVVGLMRYILFLAVLGVVASGVTLDISSQVANPALQAFQHAVGSFGVQLFGFIFWAAAITSVIGAAYTSVTFMTVFNKQMGERQRSIATVIFIAVSLVIYLMLGTAPAALLVFAGGFNGLILPIGMTLFIYVGWKRADLMAGYRYPRWLLWTGLITCALTWYMGALSVGAIFDFLKIV
ncbi:MULTISPECIES: NRAMP family divalent metal transporter [Cedecea]|jgi:Mn2+/Fe2+ NRAMP family transporter|uniref:Membrane protein n=1 Tax=Cedecea neteri TaxID=158822 RepID=A0A089RJF4_9ENTR|nr:MULTISPECIES: NRAMP family divalent metal transporter [Cedecea]AIR06585.1 membrane protein [Cedecea neteri]NWC64750.1 divalent metal cation transporter [Cedecea sp. P7760]